MVYKHKRRDAFMNIYIALIALSMSCIQSLYGSDSIVASSVLLPRSVVNNPVYDISHMLKHVYEEDWKTYIATVGIYQHSHHAADIANYFSLNGTSSFTLDESGAGDINPVQIGLMPSVNVGVTPDYYSSTLTLQPLRRAIGIMVDIHHQLTDSTWFQIKIAALQVSTTMDLVESDLNNSGSGVPNIVNARNAFNNPEWIAGKISHSLVTRSGIDDIFVRFGYDPVTFSKSPHRIGMYAYAMIPNSTKEVLEYLFHPIVGGKYTVIGGGFSGDFAPELSKDSTWSALIGFDARLGIGLNSWQPRTFDTTQNDVWSRYMLMSYQGNPDDVQYGVNVTTVHALLAQRAQAQATITLGCESENWGAHVGCNFWYRQSEKVLQFAPLENIFSIADLPQISGALIGITTSSCTANVSQCVEPGKANSMVSDAVFTPYSSANFNTQSGVNPAACTSTIWAGLRYTRLIDEAQATLECNGSYEFVQRFGSIPTWSLWANVVVEF